MSEPAMSDEQDGLVRGYRKVREGLVVSDKMDKTVVVEVEDRVKHPKYGKVIRRTKKYKAHDGENACGVGDRVLLMETRPLSATKRWRCRRFLRRPRTSNVPATGRQPPRRPATVPDPPGPASSPETGVTEQELT